jgi:hypothetical protein
VTCSVSSNLEFFSDTLAAPFQAAQIQPHFSEAAPVDFGTVDELPDDEFVEQYDGAGKA